jgi:hypothetical protein
LLPSQKGGQYTPDNEANFKLGGQYLPGCLAFSSSKNDENIQQIRWSEGGQLGPDYPNGGRNKTSKRLRMAKSRSLDCRKETSIQHKDSEECEITTKSYLELSFVIVLKPLSIILLVLIKY